MTGFFNGKKFILNMTYRCRVRRDRIYEEVDQRILSKNTTERRDSHYEGFYCILRIGL